MRTIRVPWTPLTPRTLLKEGELVLDEAASHYVARVHRLSAGDRVVLFDPEARLEADATIASIERRVACVVSAVRAASAVPTAALTLVQALGKGDKPERVVRDATALAATRIVFVESARSVVRASAWSDDKRRRFRAIAVEAARQSGRGDVPVIEGPMSLAEAATLVKDSMRLCLAPGRGPSLRAALAGRETDSIALFVGPEGGFDDGELSALAEAGLAFVVLGELVLRTEVAAAAALAAVIALRG